MTRPVQLKLYHVHILTDAATIPHDMYIEAEDRLSAEVILCERKGEIPGEMMLWQEIAALPEAIQPEQLIAWGE